MKHIGIIVAAGKGKRVGGDIPKQYMELCGKPVVFYPLKAMQESFIDEIIIVVGEGYEEYVKTEIVNAFGLDKVSAIVRGGSERSDSVLNGLRAIPAPEEAYAYIHDAARPMLDEALLQRLKEDVEIHGTAIASVKAKDTIKLSDYDGFIAADIERNKAHIIQTPQVFEAGELILAYEKLLKTDVAVTDDSSVMEHFGSLPVHLSEGDYRNIKITTPEDFLIAEAFLKSSEKDI